ncbi:hypothetical protein GPJ56_008239 [Histomonas meleagridis]|uniref:uncharacterized protein n=1 Tax=Histomonas meleagridis TaxID=135588 RepID=UPI003559E95B|nr:hypothetical protein GPJ56_008239 [Histomonas meleagridis]KAH0797261.1 hypothetical protein GO595_009943 [Histomonas meleagridis]
MEAKQRLTKKDIDELIKMQLLYDKNMEIRPIKEVAKDFPIRAIKSIGLTTAIGSSLTWASSLFVFRKPSIANNDVKIALPILTTFGGIDFGVNYTLTKFTGKVNPTRLISITSSSIAGASCGYIFGNHKIKPTLFGGVAGALYGAVRNYPMEILGFQPY